MNSELITANEVFNNGKAIYLHYNSLVGAWLAFGESAFQLAGTPGCCFSYSDELQMPCAICSQSVIRELKQKYELSDGDHTDFLTIKTDVVIDSSSYKEWVNKLK